jgi:hypothetical protein
MEKNISAFDERYAKLTEDELESLGIVLSAYRSFRGDRRKHLAYVSMPITTGKRYYDVLSAYGVRTREELAKRVGPDALFELVIKPNLREGVAFADELSRREELLFIAPSVFEARRWHWTQDAYMSLWYSVLSELAGKHIVMDGWEYSTGGLLEVLFSLSLQWAVLRRYSWEETMRVLGIESFMAELSFEQQIEEFQAMRKIRIFDARGCEIRLDSALSMAVSALEDLRERELPYEELLGPVWRLMCVPFFSPVAMEAVGMPYEPLTDLYETARDRLHRFVAARAK